LRMECTKKEVVVFYFISKEADELLHNLLMKNL